MDTVDRRMAELRLAIARETLGKIERHEPLVEGHPHGSDSYYPVATGALKAHVEQLADSLEKALRDRPQ